MTISSRTPEGLPSKCPLCGAASNLEFSEPTGDAPCPNCGYLLSRSADLLATFQRQFADIIGATADHITADTAFADLPVDSLDIVELVMEWKKNSTLRFPRILPSA